MFSRGDQLFASASLLLCPLHYSWFIAAAEQDRLAAVLRFDEANGSLQNQYVTYVHKYRTAARIDTGKDTMLG